jgi:hypothetical protein
VGGKTAFEICWLGCKQRKGMYWGGGSIFVFLSAGVFGKSRLVVFYRHFCIVRFFSFSYFPVSNYILRIDRKENDKMRLIKIHVVSLFYS